MAGCKSLLNEVWSLDVKLLWGRSGLITNKTWSYKEIYVQGFTSITLSLSSSHVLNSLLNSNWVYPSSSSASVKYQSCIGSIGGWKRPKANLSWTVRLHPNNTYN